ncbi:hypothetical protein [Bradyrhizobium sp.]|uniref:hypothetical protein n=1 Tax=Bradyrhizobium sp. TaxID=376 RepID=UPI003C785D51
MTSEYSKCSMEFCTVEFFTDETKIQKAIGLTMRSTLFALADGVIEQTLPRLTRNGNAGAFPRGSPQQLEGDAGNLPLLLPDRRDGGFENWVSVKKSSDTSRQSLACCAAKPRLSITSKYLCKL